MTIQMRHCVRAAQRGDKIAAEELIKLLSPIYTIKPRNTSGFIRISMSLVDGLSWAIDCIYQYDLNQFEETVTEMMVASVHNHLRRESYSRTCYYQRVEKTIMENDTLTDLPEDLVSEDACPELCYLEDEVRTQLYWALEQLPELQQKFIRLHFIHGYSYKQIAQKYDFRKSTVGDYVKRGLLRMRILLSRIIQPVEMRL